MSQTNNRDEFFPRFSPGDIYNVDHAQPPERYVRLGLIGAGSIAQAKHLPALWRLRATGEPVEVVSVAEPLERAGAKVAAAYSVHWYKSYQEMLDQEQLDAVLVLTPDRLHTEHALECIGRGLHVMVEKPLALSLTDSIQICQAAENRGIVLMTGFCKRFAPPYLQAKALLDDGVIGEPALIAAKNCHAWSQNDMLEHQQIHLLDLMRYFCGDVLSVSAVAANRYAESSYPFDNVSATFRFASGAIGSFYGNSTSLNLHPWERVEIYGQHRWLAVEGQYELWLYEQERAPAKNWRPNMGNSLVFDEDYIGYTGLLGNFVRSILGRSQPLSSGWDGHKALELALAVRQAAETGREITLAPGVPARP